MEAPRPRPPHEEEGGGRPARWFSVRRGSAHHYDMRTHETDKMPKLPEVGEILMDTWEEVPGSAGLLPAKTQPPAFLATPAVGKLVEDMFSCGGEVRGGRVPPPTPGPPPDTLTPVQLRRRHVAVIIHSENSYVATLQRLINDSYSSMTAASSPGASST